ncbi:serine hydrolase domain-containing protein [Microbacterium sp. NIBRBAC000506063]|uniref:serine hydrolase domain-containing protein n=1 Tax=Microbacterium sp. NIBRBAC000506063 TaxID=2734618 RepID=UPI00397EE265
MVASVGDLLTFARMHLREGVHAGLRVLSAQAVQSMQTPVADMPRLAEWSQSHGLGWVRDDLYELPVIGHDGATIGQTAALRLVPSHGLGFAVMCNSEHSPSFRQDVLREVLDALGMPSWPRDGWEATKVPDRAIAGRYEATGMTIDVRIEDDRAHLTMRYDDFIAPGQVNETTFELVEGVDGRLRIRRDPDEPWLDVAFMRSADGKDVLYYHARAHLRVT